MLKCFLFLIISGIILNAPICEEGLNNCLSCNPLTKLCVKCDLDVFIPDENGGCINSQKCTIGVNYCLECTDDQTLCKECGEGYYPDENGGCSYSDNCEVSYNGKCIKCKDNFIFVGMEDSIQICKSLNSEDLKNCLEISTTKGVCEKCEEGYYLNLGDKKCTKTEHCSESSFGICKKCSNYYYLNKKEEKCVVQGNNFYNCRESLNGDACDACNDNYYLSGNRKCVKTNFCSEGGNYNCNKCIKGYYLSEEDNICTTEENCLKGKADLGICLECKDSYMIDFKDGKCKSNEENNEYKYCKYAEGGVCKECLNWYYLGEDGQCSSSKNCSESNNGICEVCADNYYLGLDHKCVDVEHCIYSDDHFKCEECEGNYCYNEDQNICFIGEGELENCKFSYFGSWCSKCKDDFYLNQTEFLCRSNSDPNYFYKCAKTHSGINMCAECVKGYYLGYKDHKCSKIQGCEISENENKCLECNENYCLDLKTGGCEYNQRIDNNEKKIYYRCNRTNEEGTACHICMEGYLLNENGLCIDEKHCELKNEDGTCLKCQDDENGHYCLNKDFGCVDSFYGNCLECNDNVDFSECTKCAEGFKVNYYGKCV